MSSTPTHFALVLYPHFFFFFFFNSWQVVSPSKNDLIAFVVFFVVSFVLLFF